MATSLILVVAPQLATLAHSQLESKVQLEPHQQPVDRLKANPWSGKWRVDLCP
ncbi:hypothetical protein PIIN_11607 [Serendipita indica DSM 11827]|uniref:Uncharacterized protein n=1 Tax=Serendipita indica (strain DSM 11827) TaxID=1109443 RepID=G4U236_SERID|nr:hypothetical protein PIIN_11607 [Serendipita indica DSM 11827]